MWQSVRSAAAHCHGHGWRSCPIFRYIHVAGVFDYMLMLNFCSTSGTSSLASVIFFLLCSTFCITCVLAVQIVLVCLKWFTHLVPRVIRMTACNTCECRKEGMWLADSLVTIHAVCPTLLSSGTCAYTCAYVCCTCRESNARVHWWYWPDSYDSWIPADQAPETDEPDKPSRGTNLH